MALPAPENSLLQRARTGDRAAFVALCDRSRERIWRIVYGVARSRSDAEDLAQDAVVKAWCSIRECRGDAAFEAWVCTIAINAARDYCRSGWKRRVVLFSTQTEDAATASEDPALSAERLHEARRVRKAVATLPAKLCVPIWLYYFEQFTLKEIAEMEQTGESTIRNRIRLGVNRLKFALADLVGDETAAAGGQAAGEVRI